MRYRELGSTGLRLSVIGFGAAPLGNEYGSIDENEGRRAVHAALDAGINFFDTAVYYGRGVSEQRLGVALEGRRQHAIIATKCARFDVDRFDFSAESARETIDHSLARLRTDYVDILHVHDVEFGDERQIVEETIPALREIQRAGKARFIGVTGLALKMLKNIATEIPVDCVLSYCRYDLLNQDLDRELAPLARSGRTGLISASPLHMGLLSEPGGPAWHPAPAAVKAAAKEIVNLCRSRGAQVSKVALQFALAHPDISSTLVGMSRTDEVEANIAAAEGTADTQLLEEIAQIAAPVREMMWITGKPENH